MYGFIGDKMLYEARKRDHYRSRLSLGKRLEAKLKADRIVDKHTHLREKAIKEHDKSKFRESWDDAMSTAVDGFQESKSIKKLTL